MLKKIHISKFDSLNKEPEIVKNVHRLIRYGDYLYNENLSYISRNEYRSQHPGTLNLPTESEILEKLFHHYQNHGLIICGESGIGKTRLIMELCKLAEQDGWKVIIIFGRLEKYKQLQNWLQPGENNLIIFENLRENPLFRTDLIEQLNEICPAAKIKAITSCWKNFLDSSPLKECEEFLKIDISPTNNPAEQDYMKAVTNRIFPFLEAAPETFYESLNFKPAHAVFLKYLNENFDNNQLKPDVKNVQFFTQWLKMRLCLTFGISDFKDFLKLKDRLNLFYVLPAPEKRAKQLSSLYHDDIQLLIDQGWLEIEEYKDDSNSNQTTLKVTHDAIAQEILLLRLEENQKHLNKEIKDIVKFAVANGSLESCFRLFEKVSHRLMSSDVYTLLEIKKHSTIFFDILSHYIINNPLACESIRSILMVSPLLDDQLIITLLVEHQDFFEETLKRPEFGMKLAHKMKQLADIEYSSMIKDSVITLLNIWLSANPNFLEDKCLSSQLIASFILFFGVEGKFGENGETADTVLQKWLEKFPSEKETQVIMIAWLEAGGKHQTVEPYFIQWLENYPLEKETSLIIKSWLNSGGKDNVIKECLTSWLNEFPEELDTHFVIKSWLDTVGDKEVIKTYLDVWLKKFPLEMETSLVIQSWLTAKGDREIVREFIKPWLNKFPEVIETSFVITSWLEAGGEMQLIEEYLRQWLKKFPEVMEASFVIQSWLDAGGEKQIIEEYLKQWLKKYPGVIEASFVIKSWLEAGGEKQLIESYLKQWLNRFPGKFETRFVICSWLDVGGEKLIIRDYLKPWLKKFPLEKGTSFVIKSWLDAKGEKRLVENYIYPWLKTFPLEMEASFVFQAWLEAGGEKQIIEEYIKPWLETFPLDIETSFVIKSWLAAGGNQEIVKDFIKPWLEKYPLEEKDTSFVIRAWLNACGNAEEVKTFVMKWLERYHNCFEASFVIKAWLKNTRDADSIKTFALKWLRAFKDHPRADYVIKRFCNYEDIPADVLDAAIHWYKKYIDTSEALYTLLYLTRHQINNEKIAAQWLLDDLANRANKPVASLEDIKNLEFIMYDISKNKEFCFSEKGIQLSVTWFMSEHSFHPVTLQKNDHFLQQWWYFERYSRLLLDNRIDIVNNKERTEKFLRWVNGWHPRNKDRIKRNLNKLTKALPRFNYLWEIVDIQ